MWSMTSLWKGLCDIIACINRGLSQRWLLRRSFPAWVPQLDDDLDACLVEFPHSALLKGHGFKKAWSLSEYSVSVILKKTMQEKKKNQCHDLQPPYFSQISKKKKQQPKPFSLEIFFDYRLRIILRDWLERELLYTTSHRWYPVDRNVLMPYGMERPWNTPLPWGIRVIRLDEVRAHIT